MVADIVKVPSNPAVAWDPPLPAGVLRRRAVVLNQSVNQVLIRDIGERKALRGKAHVGTASVLERSQVRANTEVMRRSYVREKRQSASARRRGPVRHVRPQLVGKFGEHLREQWRAPEFPGRADHGSLLLDFAVATKHGDAACELRAIKKATNLLFDSRAKALIVPRIVQVGKGIVLPDEDSELVAYVVKGVGLVEKRTAYAHHVHPGSSHGLERFAVRGIRARQRDGIEWS